MSHGLTLTEANTIVWYAPEWSNDTYNQANARISRPGQKNSQHIIHISGSEIERKIYARLRDRSKMQGVLLDAVASFTRSGAM
jgi:SNF2 family DNA or RNA helicase